MHSLLLMGFYCFFILRAAAQSVSVTTLAGGNSSGVTSGTTNGIGTSALFRSPYSIAVGKLGILYVVDMMNRKVRAIFPNRTVLTVAGGGLSGNSAGAVNGIGTNALFYNSFSIAVDKFDTLYVADSGNNKVRAISPGRTVTTVAGAGASGNMPGSNNGIGTNAHFSNPSGVAVDASLTVYVADFGNHKIRAISPSLVVTTLAGGSTAGNVPGLINGVGSNALFTSPYGVAINALGTLFISDVGNNKLRAIAPDQTVTTFAGGSSAGNTAGADNGIGTNALFNYPYGVSVDASGTVYVADSNNHMIRAIFPDQTVMTIAGNTTAGSLDGSSALFNHPAAVIANTSGGILYVADQQNHRIRIISPIIVSASCQQARLLCNRQ